MANDTLTTSGNEANASRLTIGVIAAGLALLALPITAAASVPRLGGASHPKILLVSNPDSEIAVALSYWASAMREWRFGGVDMPETQADALYDLTGALEERIASIPASTVEGLAIKSYMAMYRELGGCGENWLQVDFDTSQWLAGQNINRAIVADALRLSPMLAEIVGADA